MPPEFDEKFKDAMNGKTPMHYVEKFMKDHDIKHLLLPELAKHAVYGFWADGFRQWIDEHKSKDEAR